MKLALYAILLGSISLNAHSSSFPITPKEEVLRAIICTSPQNHTIEVQQVRSTLNNQSQVIFYVTVYPQNLRFSNYMSDYMSESYAYTADFSGNILSFEAKSVGSEMIEYFSITVDSREIRPKLLTLRMNKDRRFLSDLGLDVEDVSQLDTERQEHLYNCVASVPLKI